VVFSNILRGLSGAKVTRPGTFRSSQHGYAVKSALKAEDGLLYPLEKSLFFLPKPPTLILHEQVCLYKKNFCRWLFIHLLLI
jgi:structure-specific recognition protein 1